MMPTTGYPYEYSIIRILFHIWISVLIPKLDGPCLPIRMVKDNKVWSLETLVQVNVVINN